MAEGTNVVTTFHVEGKICLHWESKTGELLSLEMINALYSEDPVASSSHGISTSSQRCSVSPSADPSAICMRRHAPEKRGTASQPCCQDDNAMFSFSETAPKLTAADSSENCNYSRGISSRRKGVFMQLGAKNRIDSGGPVVSSFTEVMKPISSSHFTEGATKSMEKHKAAQDPMNQSAESDAVVERVDGIQSLGSTSGQVKSRFSSLMDKLTRLISFENNHQRETIAFHDSRNIHDSITASISVPPEYRIKKNDPCTSLSATGPQEQRTNSSSKGRRRAYMEAGYTVRQSDHVSTSPLHHGIVETDILHDGILETVNHSMDAKNSFASASSTSMTSEQANVTHNDMPLMIRSSVDLTNVDVHSINETCHDTSVSNPSFIYVEESATAGCAQQNKRSRKRSRENIKPSEGFSSKLQTRPQEQRTSWSSKGSECAHMDAGYIVRQSDRVSTAPFHHDIVETLNHSVDAKNSLASASSRSMTSEQANVAHSDMPLMIQSPADLTNVAVHSVDETCYDTLLSNPSLICPEESASTVCAQQNNRSRKRSRENIKPSEGFSSTLQTTSCDKVATEFGGTSSPVLSPTTNDRQASIPHSGRKRNKKSKKMRAVDGEVQLHSGHMSRQLHENLKEMPAIGLLYQDEKNETLPSRRIRRQHTGEMGENSVGTFIEEGKRKESCSPSALVRCVKGKKRTRIADASQGTSNSLPFPEDAADASAPGRLKKKRHIPIQRPRKRHIQRARRRGSPSVKVAHGEVRNSRQVRRSHHVVRRARRRRGCLSRKKRQKACGHSSSRGLRCTRPRNSFIFFCMKKRARIVSSRLRLKFGRISKLLGETWVNMSDAAKKPYRIQARQDAKRYYRRVLRSRGTGKK